ncbi:MAG: hypothetical protein HY831_03255 [Candidatus Aenigmarchaeota archaeon]|nr:hypothetical protein [Candidatus Aenigmarchaeota archaeon]
MDRRSLLKFLRNGAIALVAYATGCTNNKPVDYRSPTSKNTPETSNTSASATSPEDGLPNQITVFNEHPITRYYSLREKLGAANGRWSENGKGRHGYVPMDHHWVEIEGQDGKKYMLSFEDNEGFLNTGLYSEDGEDLKKIKDLRTYKRSIEGVHTIEQNGLPRMIFRLYKLNEAVQNGRHPIDIYVYSLDLQTLFYTSTYEDSSVLSADITRNGQESAIVFSPSSSERFQVYDLGFSRSADLERTMEGLYSNFSSMASNRNLGGLANFQNEFGTQLALACVRVFPVPNPRGGLMSFDSYVRRIPGFERFEGTPIGKDPVGTVGRVLVGAQTPEDFARNNWGALGFNSKPLYTPGEAVVIQDRGDVQEVRTQSGHVMWRNPADDSYRYSVGGPSVTRDQRTVEIQHADGSRTYEHRDPVSGRSWESNR